MEIFQTIWTALTTENETLTVIICSPLIFIEMYISMLLSTTILNIKVNLKQKILYVAILGIIGLVTAFNVPAPYNTYINIIACPILVYFLFKAGLLKSILAEIIPYIFFLILGSIIMVICVLLNIDSNVTTTVPIYKLLYSISLYLVTYFIYRLFNKYHININIINKMKKQNFTTLLINFIIAIISIALQVYIATTYIDQLPLYIIVINIIVLLLYFFISMYSLYRTNKLEVTTENLEQEILYNKTLTILYDNIRGFKHDFNNIVQAIGGYVATNNINGLQEYYSDLMSDCQKINNLSLINPEHINNPAIYSLFTSKYHKAEELGIKITFDIFANLQDLNIKTYDLTRILGILLDNAIEASEKCKKKIINITMRKDNKASRHLVIIENTYKNKNVNIDKIFEKGYSSKTDDRENHGLGLWEVRKILKKNNNLNLFTTKNEQFFQQQLEIYF